MESRSPGVILGSESGGAGKDASEGGVSYVQYVYQLRVR